MALVKLKSSNTWKAGQKNILPYVGEVVFNENAEIEVNEAIVEKLIEFSNEFSLVEPKKEEDIKKKSEDSEELGKSDEPNLEPQVEESEVLGQVEEVQPVEETENTEVVEEGEKPELTKEEKEAIIKEKLAKISVKEIKEQYLSQFPEELIKDLKNRDQYIEFIVNQLV